MDLVTFLKLIRWKNIALLIYTQLILKYVLFTSFNLETILTNFQFTALTISIACIASAGNIINDIFDVKTDLINKPHKVIVSKIISIETANKYYLFLNVIGVVSGIGVALSMQKPNYSFVFIVTPLLLYFYSKKLKTTPLIGNLLVSLLIALSIVILYYFDVNRTIKSGGSHLVKLVIIFLTAFSFLLNLVRELLKDIEDVKGDYTLNMKTLPIYIGISRSQKIAFYSCMIPIALLLFIIINYAQEYNYLAMYLLIFTLIPLLYVLRNITKYKSKKSIHKITTIIKIIMFFGINSILILSFNPS